MMITFLLCMLVPPLMLLLPAARSEIRVQMQTAEELINGTLFGNLRTKLVQTGHYTQTHLATGYRQQFMPDNSYVIINPVNGNLYTKQRIDRESICEDEMVRDCRLKLNVAQQSPTGSIEFILINLEIVDINDNAPSWQSHYIPLNIPEHTEVGKKFALPTATDIDRGPMNTTHRYGIRRQSDPKAFTLETNLMPSEENAPRKFKLWLKINKDLDREIVEFYQVELYAIDGGTPSLTGSVTLNITILDINDQIPVFVSKNSKISVPENTLVNNKIFQVRATDLDPSDFKRLRYSLGTSASKSIRKMFSIDSLSGAVFVTGNLDFEKKSQYTIPVTVTDGKHMVDTTVTVDVTNLNDNSPVISIQSFSGASSELSVRENLEAGKFIASVTVTDGDDKLGKQPIHCQVDKSSFEVRPLFDEAKTQFKLLTKTSFDRENQTEYYATITCFDNGQPPKSSSQSFRVKILDVNDNAPVFPPYQMTKEVEENAPPGTLVYRAEAKDIDADENAQLHYSLDRQSADFFTIDEKTGDIKTRLAFDREQRTRFDITVIAKDRGFSMTPSPTDISPKFDDDLYRSHTVQGSLTVLIKDVNDCQPIFDQPTYHFSVEEGQKANRQIGSVNAHDSDVSRPNNVIHFYMKHDEGNKAMLDFRVSSRGQIFVARDGIDREETPNYSFYIIARDDGVPSLSSSVNVQIQVLDINDNLPQWIFPSDSNKSINITYRSPVGHRVTQLSALDRDEGVNAEVHYSILQSKSNLFELDSETGALYVAKTMTVKDLGMLKMVVEARDRGTPQQYSHRVLDINIVTQIVANSNRHGRLEGDLVIIVVMVAITLVISMVLIAAILFLRCRACPLGGRFKRVRGGRMYSPDGELDNTVLLQ